MADALWRRGALLVAGVAVLLLAAVPVAELLRVTVGQGAAALASLGGAAGVPAVANTLWTGLAVTPAAVGIGMLAALVTERTRAPATNALRLVMLVPLIVPGFVTALSWGRAYGPSGIVDDIAGLSMPGLFGPAGVAAVLTVEAVPIAYLVIAAALTSRSEADAERAARASGATAADTLRTITLPLLRPALAGAGALVFVATINAFGVPAVLGRPAGFTTVTTRIYLDLVQSADPTAFARAITMSAALALAGAALVAPLVSRRLRQPVVRPAVVSSADARRGPRWPGLVLWGFVIATAGVPLTALVLSALTRAAGLAPVPANWTLRNFGAALRPPAAEALATSLLLAGCAATVVLALGLALLLVRRTRTGSLLRHGATLPFALPGSALAVAMLLTYGSRLRDTLTIIVLAYVAKFWALGYRPLEGAADTVPPDLLRAARVSGAAPGRAAWTVALPLLRPALAAAWLIVFLFSVHELTMSALLYGPGRQTLAVLVLNVAQLGDVTVTSALASLLTFLIMILGALLLPLRRAGRGGL